MSKRQRRLHTGMWKSWSLPKQTAYRRCYRLELECPPKAVVFQDWSLVWHHHLRW